MTETSPKEEAPKEAEGTRIVELDKIKAGLESLKKEYKIIPDCKTKDGYLAIKVTVKKGRDLIKEIEVIRNQKLEDARTYTKSVNTEAKAITASVLEIVGPHKEAKTIEDTRVAKEKQDLEDAEAKKIEEITARMDGMKQIFISAIGKNSEEIKAMLDRLEEIEVTEDLFGDFMPEANATKEALTGKLNALIDTVTAQEEAQAKLEEQQAVIDAQKEEQRIEDERKRKEDDKKNKAERERLEKESEANLEKMRIANADLKAKQDAFDEKQRKQDEAQKIIDDERQRLLDEADRAEREAKEKADREEAEEKEAEERAEREHKEKMAQIKAEKLAKKEAGERFNKLMEAIVEATGSNNGQVKNLIEMTEQGHIPYLTINWTKE